MRRWAKTCLQCQKAKVQRHTITPLAKFATPDARFDNIHLDIVGPLPPSRGYSYILTCSDRFTRWPEAIPITNITAESVARAFVSGWISRFGVPSTDCGSQFESALWTQLMQLLGSKRIRTTAYHPIANGFIERLHRQLKTALKSHPNPTYWADSLPLVLLGIRTALIHGTSAELVYGTSLGLPGKFFNQATHDTTADPTIYVTNLKSVMQRLKAIPVRCHPQRKVHVSKALATCTHVFVRCDAIRKPLQPPYDGPYKVLERTDKYFIVDVKGKHDIISLDRLKPAHLDTEESDAGSVSTPSTTTTHFVTSPTVKDSQPTTRVTRSGRRVHYPVRFSK